MTLGDLTKQFRLENGLTMDCFAERAGLTKAYVSMLENGNKNRGGKRPAPSINTYKGCAKAMGIELSALIELVDDKISTLPPESDYSYEEIDLIRAWRKASEKDKTVVAAALGEYGFSYIPKSAPNQKVG